MKKSQLQEARSKDLTELRKMLWQKNQELAKMLIDLNSKKLRNVALKKNTKKAVAQIQTLIREKEIRKI